MGSWLVDEPLARSADYPPWLDSSSYRPKTLRRLAKISGIPQLFVIPPELVDMIRQYSIHKFLWLSISAISLATRLSMGSEPLLKIPLDAILTWDRGGNLIRTSSSNLPWIRLTIDPHGISKVERLSERPLYDGAATEHLAFIVEQVADINTELKVRSFRFSMSWYLIHDRMDFYSWNSPSRRIHLIKRCEV